MIKHYIPIILGCLSVFGQVHAKEFHAPPAPESNRAGSVFYVSKLGDNTDGSSWIKAFHTIQAALDAIPDDKGGHRILIRPDTYMEAMLSPAFSGAAGAYNELIGDVDGRQGSGAAGRVIIDSGDPAKGFKSYDWWGPIRANQEGWSKEHTDPTFSSIIWDRWILRNLYVTGSDGGLFWDCTNRIEPFTVIVEDCMSMGRAFGGGVASCLSRTEEPIVFRRCHLWALDWWGDTAGAYVRVENPKMPDRPDIYFEDCTMVSPQCALKGGNYGFHTFMRVKTERCRLVALNFSQPQGTPTDGIIQSVQNGKYLHVDLEDTTVMGFKVFGVKVDKDSASEIQYTTKGAVQAYVQFTQDIPKGFHRLVHWPTYVFDTILPPPKISPARRLMQSTELIRKDMCELSPIVWKDRLLHMDCVRPAHGGARADYYLRLSDSETGEVMARFAEGYGLACAFVYKDTFYAFASRFENNDWNDVTLFKSSDLKHWESKQVIQQENEHLFNSSVCEGPDGFIMAYESNDPTYPPFTTKFSVSKDLETWIKIPDAIFGTDRYTACPCIRYANGCYYVLYLEHRSPRHYFETYITRSKDLKHWERSSANPVLIPFEIDDGINASDPDLVEWQGKTYIYYAVGDQLTWMNLKRCAYPGPLSEYLESWYKNPGIPDPGDYNGFQQRKAKENSARLDAERERRLAWFREAKFGMFIHWGLYAVHGKNDKGPYVSWSMENEKIPVDEYKKYTAQFSPSQFNAEEWVDIAKSAGMRYMIFTSKHHEGFCMFDSALTDYNTKQCAAGRDFVRELIKAARSQRDEDRFLLFHAGLVPT